MQRTRQTAPQGFWFLVFGSNIGKRLRFMQIYAIMNIMERPQTTPELNQIRVRGLYEERFTDTSYLSAELSMPQDLARLAVDFDNGNTSLRDVGEMGAWRRKLILDLYQEKSIKEMATDAPFLFTVPVMNLHDRVVHGERDQSIGHNFFVNASWFLSYDMSWAKQFNDYIQVNSGLSVIDIAHNPRIDKDSLLAAFTDTSTLSPDEMAIVGVYLAGRSRMGEQYQQDKYGEVMEYTKGQVFATTQEIARTTGLRTDMLNRASGQLQRTTFGSFDHLATMVTSDNRDGVMGDYQTGSLRLEVLAKGTARNAVERTKEEAYHIIAHELNHAASAQDSKTRVGLKMNDQGLELDEGMTEYLAQLAIGSPNIERMADGSVYVSEYTPYREAVFTMLVLHQQFKAGRNNHFATLFNAYHGDMRSLAHLKQALDAFYQHETGIALISGI